MVVTENMVQQPEICCDTGMECIAQFQYAVQRRPLKCLGMLVVVIPGANTAFWNNIRQIIQRKCQDIVYCEVEDKIERCKEQYKNYGNAVF